MIQYFKNINGQTVEIDKPELGSWVNLVPPFKEEEFIEVSEELEIPIEFLRDSLDIDERPRYELEDNVKFVVIKTPTENNSFNDSDAYYITIPICIILTHNQIVTVNSFDNPAIKKFLNSFERRHPDKRNMMVLKIFEKMVQNYMEYLKEINHKRNILEQKLYSTNQNIQLLNLMRIQKSLVYFVNALRSNEMLMMKLERSNFLGLTDEERDFLNDLVVDTSQALEMANTYTNILNNTMEAYATIIANNQVKILKRMAVAFIVLLIPLVITNVFGMQLTNGLEQSANAFYTIILISFIFSGILGWWFFRKQSFK